MASKMGKWTGQPLGCQAVGVGTGGAGGRSLLGFGEEPDPGPLNSTYVHLENRHSFSMLITDYFKIQCMNRACEV